MVEMAQAEITDKIFEALSEAPVSFYKLCRRTKLHSKTVRRYLELIKDIQAKEKITTEQSGFRVLIRKKANALPCRA
ncbi:hypothetical protein J4441_00015 [Candidatus Micrarchaeota archaeon]|nr:hypothetical protein [Candidatus Micrarchaeota archaeon]